MTTTAHPPAEMLAGYAAGTLSRGMALVVAGHASFCPCCRDRIARLAALCGALFASCAEPQPPSARCLEAALARIGRPEKPAPARAAGGALPAPLCHCLAGPLPALDWRPVAPGLARCRLDGFPDEEVGLVRAEPGTRVARHGHAGPEATLVLEGRLRDGPRTYACGDIALCDETVEHSPESVGAEPCLYLVVAPAPALQAT